MQNWLQFNTTTVILHKEKKHDFEMSTLLLDVLTIMVHFIGVPIIKSCSSSLTP